MLAKPEPMKVGLAVADIFTGLYATVAILAALNERRVGGLMSITGTPEGFFFGWISGAVLMRGEGMMLFTADK